MEIVRKLTEKSQLSSIKKTLLYHEFIVVYLSIIHDIFGNRFISFRYKEMVELPLTYNFMMSV